MKIDGPNTRQFANGHLHHHDVHFHPKITVVAPVLAQEVRDAPHQEIFPVNQEILQEPAVQLRYRSKLTTDALLRIQALWKMSGNKCQETHEKLKGHSISVAIIEVDLLEARNGLCFLASSGLYFQYKLLSTAKI